MRTKTTESWKEKKNCKEEKSVQSSDLFTVLISSYVDGNSANSF